MPGHNKTNFKWNKGRTLAARLVAEDELNDEDIAAAAGVRRSTLAVWKKHPEFHARVQEHIEAWRRLVMAEGIAKRENRVSALNERWQLLKRVIAERAATYAGDGDDDDPPAPGAATGLLVRQVKSVGFGENNMVITEWVVDTGTLAEMRAIERQAAQEVGQWLDRSENTHKVEVEDELRRMADEHGIGIDEARSIFESELARLKGGKS